MPPKKEWKLVLLTPSEDYLKEKIKQKGVHRRCIKELKSGVKHEQQTALDLAVKLHSGPGTSTFFCHLLKASNDEVTEKKLVNILPVLCKT
uniref:CARD domain-containing protein n=1 Tax=Plectus sambesii TaxID=2011161 RepID=A0A914WBI9_9BILA